MKQVTQTLRTGVVEVNDVPIPTLTDAFVLVANNASVISAGTEKTKIDMGKKNLLQMLMKLMILSSGKRPKLGPIWCGR